MAKKASNAAKAARQLKLQQTRQQREEELEKLRMYDVNHGGKLVCWCIFPMCFVCVCNTTVSTKR